ncbi:MAG: glycerophosphodiester phosphodiesterase [Acidobacteria bacterium]|nr:glycerophosphodiester phosphodiesterase [Acidobacteriota bacterium]MBI3427277.1 glycerophosphodiester phosphodiesterase [Acidobacteriota bacterium]
MSRTLIRLGQLGLLALLLVSLPLAVSLAQPEKKILIAHRGASGYAPEHTIEAYRLGIEQKADFIEQDLQITKDGVLVCLHDLTLERTTDIEEVFPERATVENGVKHWYVADFTLAEIKRLDAGSWFNEKFKGTRVLTFTEAIQAVRGKAGLYPETKEPEVYGKRGFEMEKLLLAELKKHKLDQPNADPKTPIIIQSFSAASLRKLAFELNSKLTRVFLVHNGNEKQWLNPAGLQEVKKFADGIGPSKSLIEAEPKIVQWAHELGLTVTPYTFHLGQSGKYKDVREEMRQFLFTYGVDALFTDNPDQFPR